MDSENRTPTSPATGTGTAPLAPANAPPPPEEEPLRRRPSELNLRQVKALTKARQIALSAQKAEYASALESKGIEMGYAQALLDDIAAVERVSTRAVQATVSKEAATLTEQAKQTTLLGSLRELQSAGRQLHQHGNPVVLKEYLIGEKIDESRPRLEQSAETIINKANAERPPGVDTSLIVRAQQERDAFVSAGQNQESELTRAQNERAARNTQVRSIVQRSQVIQFAADRAFGWRNPAHAGARRVFRLPARRTYTA